MQFEIVSPFNIEQQFIYQDNKRKEQIITFSTHQRLLFVQNSEYSFVYGTLSAAPV